MKIKEGFVVEKVGNAYLAVAVGERADNFNALIHMNSTGAYIWEKLAERDMTEGELLAVMKAEYDAPEELLLRDISAFVNKLRCGGLLDD